MPTLPRFLSPLFAAVVCFLAQSGTAGSALAQAAKTGPKPVTWLVTCSNQAAAEKLACSMTHVVFQEKPRRRIMTATLARDKAGSPRMRLQLPHGLDLTKGVNIATDGGQAVNYPIRTSNANGAFTTIAISDDMMAGLKAANTLAISVTGNAGRTININLPLKGFAKSFSLLK